MASARSQDKINSASSLWQDAAMIARRLLVSGHVQGVWYRDWMVARAIELGLAGWVRNLADGRVEAIVEGERAAVETMIAAAREGSPKAEVREVTVSNVAPEGAQSFGKRADG